MNQEQVRIISRISLFRGIHEEEIAAMLDCMKPRALKFAKNDLIAAEGDGLDSIGIILKGEAAVSKENAAGGRVVLTLLGQGDIFGEMAAFSNRPKWPATVQAQEHCEVFFLPAEKIVGGCEKACPWHRTLIRNLLGLISERALMLNKKVEYLTIKSMRGKISTFLLEQYRRTGDKNILLPFNRNELADFLNVSRPSMSRELCKMRDEGVIDFHLSAFRLLDIGALKLMSLS